MFIGLRPFTLFMEGDTICVYTPLTAIVRVKNGSVLCSQPSRCFSKISTDKDVISTYSPSLCCDISADGFPSWFVPESASECEGSNIIYDVIGIVNWNAETGLWEIDQHIVGSHTFNYTLDKVPGQVVQNARATLTDDMHSIILDDGSIQELSSDDFDAVQELGLTPGGILEGELSYAFEGFQ